MMYHNEGVEKTCSMNFVSVFPPSPKIYFSVRTTAWRTSQSPCPRDIQMGSSPTATVAIESRWPCRNTWQRFWEEGTDRESGIKDADLPICSDVKAPKLPPHPDPLCKYIQSLNHPDISDQPVDCACVLSTCIYVWSKAIKMNILIIICFFSFCTKALDTAQLWTNILFSCLRCWKHTHTKEKK